MSAEVELKIRANGMTLDEGMQIVLRSCLTQIAENVAAVIDSDDPEGPHQLRVGLRRLRTALSVTKSETTSSATKLGAQAKRIGACVAPVRDLDVMRNDIVAPLADRVDVSGVFAVLDEERQKRRGSLLAELKGPDVGGFLTDLAEFVEMRGWASRKGVENRAVPLSEFAASEVRRRWSKIRKHAVHAKDLDETGRHELRKKFRRLRYTVDGFAGVLDKKTLARTRKQTRKAQNVLGYLNDVNCSRHLPALIRKPGVLAARPDSEAIGHAVGFVLGWHEAQAARAWAKTVKELKLLGSS
jgi:CHAD domain-containing protein